IACKTGTCGTKEGNTDAYAISYTSQHIIGVWEGDKSNIKLNITGGKNCCEITKEIMQSIYKDNTPPPIDINSDVCEIQLDKNEYENNNKIILCDDICPLLNRIKVVCSNSNVPKEKSSAFTKPIIKKPTITVENNNICIQLCHAKYYAYIINRKINDNIDIIYDGEWKQNICEKLPAGEYEYCIIPYFSSNGKKYYGDEIWLPKIKIENSLNDDELTPKIQIPDIANKDWFDSNF
ncbi:MAG: hypothetical protein ACI4QI_03145, partial [Candidatus Coproplasma sp.]